MTKSQETNRRQSELSRTTSETSVKINLCLDGEGKTDIETPVPFFNHMLELMAFHAEWDLLIEASGDTIVDDHHLIEDVGIVLGQVIANCIHDKKGVKRYSDIHLPMDEVLMLAAVDVSGRSHLSYQVNFFAERSKNFDLCLIQEFLKSMVRESKITLHLHRLAGEDPHHIAEAIFKSVGKVLGEAMSVTNNTKIPSTKGEL